MTALTDLYKQVGPVPRKAGKALEKSLKDLTAGVALIEVRIEELAAQRKAAESAIENPLEASVEELQSAYALMTAIEAKQDAMGVDLRETKALREHASQRLAAWVSSFRRHIDEQVTIDLEIDAWERRKLWHQDILAGDKSKPRPGNGPLTKILNSRIDAMAAQAKTPTSEVTG